MKIQVANVNPTKLHDELIKANFLPLKLENDLAENQTVATNTWLTYPDDSDRQAIQSIIDAHNPAPLPQLPTAEERISSLETLVLQLGGVI